MFKIPVCNISKEDNVNFKHRNIACGHIDKVMNKKNVYYNLVYAAMGVFASTEDLLHISNNCFNKYFATKNDFENLLRSNGKEISDYELGWHVRKMFDRMILNHGGSSRGYKSFMVKVLDDDVVIVALCNDSSSQANMLCLEVLKAIYET